MRKKIALKVGNYRWRICALLFFATTVNYIDRNVLSFTKLDDHFRKEMLGLRDNIELSEAHKADFNVLMGDVDTAFKIAYALGFLIMGFVIDRLGTRKGFSIAITIWSIAGVLNGFVGSVKSLSITRFLLGIGEAGNFPSAVKTVAEWFPRKERSFATGLFNAGANIGVILTALAVPFITVKYGWRASFVVTGLLGFLVLIMWRLMYRKPEQHHKLETAEYNHINADKDEEPAVKVSWLELLKHRQTWAFAIGKFMADPIWYFYLFWLPDFFNSSKTLEQKLDLSIICIPFIIIYLVSDAGSVFFGWLSSYMIKKGWSVNKARKITMLICALCVVPIVFASVTSSIYVAVALISLAAAAHQGWSANNFTIASDMFPKQYLGSVVGIGSMFGAVGGILFAKNTAAILNKFGFFPLFAIAGSAYLIALIIIHLLAPKLEAIESNKHN